MTNYSEEILQKIEKSGEKEGRESPLLFPEHLELRLSKNAFALVFRGPVSTNTSFFDKGNDKLH